MNIDEMNMSDLDDDMVKEVMKVEQGTGVDQKEKNEELPCNAQCLVKIPTEEANREISDIIKKLKDFFHKKKDASFFKLVLNLSKEIARLYSSNFYYYICPKASKCIFTLHDLKLHREILRAILHSPTPETVMDNRLIWMLDHAEGLRSTILIGNIDPESNSKFQNWIENVRARVYHHYKMYGKRKNPRERRLFEEGIQVIELEINKIVGHIITAGMRRREEIDKWNMVQKDLRRYLRQCTGQGAMVSPMAAREPATLRAAMEGDDIFTKMSLDDYSDLRRQQEQQTEAQKAGQLAQIKNQPKMNEKIKAIREKFKKKKNEKEEFVL
jgi:hypothetical protein